MHLGIDLKAKLNTPVYAAESGGVIFSGWKRGYGWVVILKHIDGYSTVYAHHSKNLVCVGEKIRIGQRIALSGKTGRVTGPHLHFEIRRHSRPVNPMEYLSEKSHFLF